MNIPCPACTNGPSGPAGHDALFARALGRTGISLQCRSCHSPWQRMTDRKLGFVWTTLGAQALPGPYAGGAILPRSTGSVGRLLPVRKAPDFDLFVATILDITLGQDRQKRGRP